jgi:pimeloyl-ACP methyl ester carboxylesterase
VIAALTVTVLVAGAAVIALRTPSPVGHWDGAEGFDRYLAAYEETFEDLPDPDEVHDVRTDYGVVRVYRFASTREDGSDHDGTTEHDTSSAPVDPLVLLPGRSSGTPVWADNLPSLQDVGDVYAIDLLGEPGLSVQSRPIESDADQAAWLDQTLAQLPEDRFHLVGLSIGGWTAANLATHTTQHVAGLTLLDAPLVFDDLPLGTVLRTIPVAFTWAPRAWRDSFNSYTAGGAPVEDVPVAYRLRLPAPARIDEERLTGIDVPVLALIAGRSVMHDPAVAAATATRVMGAEQVHVYDDASHALNGEYPQEIAADIDAFARSLH